MCYDPDAPVPLMHRLALAAFVLLLGAGVGLGAWARHRAAERRVQERERPAWQRVEGAR